MKSKIIYRGKAIDVPSFHADRLISKGLAKLPKRVAATSKGEPVGKPQAPAEDTQAQSPAPGTQEKQTPPASQAKEPDAGKQASAPKQAGGESSATGAAVLPPYTRRDLKAQD